MGPRVFVAFDKVKEDLATIGGSDVNYLKNVMRLKVGDELSIMDSKSKEYNAKIKAYSNNEIIVELLGEKHPKSESRVKITIAQGIPKNPKMDLVVQKATELGAQRIIPIKTERSVIKLTEEKEEAKINRWQKIAKEAAEQSGRLIIPFVDTPKEIKELLIIKNDFDKCVILWEMEKEMTIKRFLQENHDIKSLLVMIGPEGGFSHDEVELVKKEGFVSVNIGSRIVRTETAAISVLSMIDYEFEL
jgi:16S rRNA (uracil1498-N3)-methyltransferase